MTGRSAQVARGLNTIASRIVKNEDALKEYGVALYDSEGNLRSTYDVLKDLSDRWSGLSDTQRINLGQTLAGVNQYKVFAAVMGNFKSAVKATEVATNSAGSANKENAKYLDSIQAKVEAFKSQLEQLATKTISSGFVKNLISMGTSILRLGTNLGSLLPLISTFLSMPLAIGIGKISTAIRKLEKSFKDGTSGLSKFINAFKTGKIGISDFSTALGIVATAISLAISAVEIYKAKQRELMQDAASSAKNTVEQVQSMNDLKKEYENIVDSTDDEATKTENLTKFKEKLVEQYGFEKDAIDKVTLSRKDGIAAIEDEQEATIVAEKAKIQAEYDKAQKEVSKSRTANLGTVGTMMDESYVEPLKQFGIELEQVADSEQHVSLQASNMYDYYDKLTKAIDYLSEKQRSKTGLNESEVIIYGQLKSALGSLSKDYDSYTSVVESYNQLEAQKIILQRDELKGTVNSVKSFNSYKTAMLASVSGNKGLQDAMSTLIDQMFPNYAKGIETVSKDNDEAGNSSKNLSNDLEITRYSFSSLLSSISIVNEAMSEMNDKGYMSADTFDKLSNILPDVAKKAVQVGDGYYIQTDALQTVINSNYEYANVALNQARDAAIDLINQQSDVKLAYDATTDSIRAQATALALKARAEGIAADNAKYSGRDTTARVYSNPDVDALMEIVAQINQIESGNAQRYYVPITSKGSSGGSSSGGSGGSSSSEKSPLEQQADSFKAEIDLYNKRLALMKASDMSSNEERINYMEAIQNRLKEQEDWYISQGLDSNDEYIVDLQTQWWGYYHDIQDLRDADAKAQEEANKKVVEDNQNSLSSALSYVQKLLDKQIDALNDKKSSIESYYDKQISALDTVNNKLNDQITLQQKLDALQKAKATKKMVYKDGKFQYVSDTDAISQAQADLDSYKREKALSDKKAQLEEKKQKALDAIEQQITDYQKYKDFWSNASDEYQYQQNKKIASTYFNSGITSGVLSRDLSWLNWFVENYVKTENASTGNTVSSSALKKHANGTTYASNGMALVGEQGAELRILNSGDGIIPATLTSNLMQLGRYSPTQWFTQLKGTSVNNSGSSTSISVANITLPNVKNAQEFVSGLKNLAYQYSTQRV